MIYPNNMTLQMYKDHKSKKLREKKVYILADDINSKRKFEIKFKQISAWKGLIQAVVFKTLILFYKILGPWKISLFTLQHYIFGQNTRAQGAHRDMT